MNSNTRLYLWLGVLCALAATTLGCLPDTTGVDPPSDEIKYPVGLALTPDSSHLVVANSNFDLSYNAGTVVALDVSSLGAAKGERSQDGAYYYLDAAMLIEAESTVRIGAFASDLAATPRGEKLLVPVRGQRSIEVIDVAGKGRVLECGQGSDRRCDSAHRVRSNDRFSLPIEPYEVATLDYYTAGGKSAAESEADTRVTMGMASHMANGDVSLFVVERASRVAGADSWRTDATEPNLVAVAQGVIPGASGISVNRASGSDEIYVSGRRVAAPFVAVLRVLTGPSGSLDRPFFNLTGSIEFGRDLLAGTDARGIVVAETGPTGGKRGWLVTRSPQALLSLDLENRSFVDMTILGAEPSVVELLEAADGNKYAFVLCFATSQVFVVDALQMQVLAVRSTGKGPHAITFDRERGFAYIANFRESTISILSAAPPFDHIRLSELSGVSGDAGDVAEDDPIVKIGKPRLPKSHS